MGDLNQHGYEGKLQEAFNAEDIGLEEQFRKLFDEDAPFSRISGSTPIYGVFVTSRIDCEAALISSHRAVVGYHRLGLFDLKHRQYASLTEEIYNVVLKKQE